MMDKHTFGGTKASETLVDILNVQYFSHKELQSKSTGAMLGMLKIINQPWQGLTDDLKYGRIIVKEDYDVVNPFNNNVITKRTRWVSKPAWKFTEDKERLLNMVPKYE